MVRNDALPRIEVNPETYEVLVDGVVATVPAAQTLPLAQKYFIV
jgi:urease alpha subunit